MYRIAVLALSALLAAAGPAPGGEVTIAIGGVKAKGGTVRVALYDKGPLYRVPPAYLGEARVSNAGDVTIVIRDVVPGTYAVSAFHDVDGDGRLGMASGRLTEGTALSNAEKLRSAPTFDAVGIAIPAGASRTAIAMSYPEDRAGW